jgi:hypothetical protein
MPDHKIAVTDRLADALKLANSVNSSGKPRVILLENDLPDNYI